MSPWELEKIEAILKTDVSGADTIEVEAEQFNNNNNDNSVRNLNNEFGSMAALSPEPSTTPENIQDDTSDSIQDGGVRDKHSSHSMVLIGGRIDDNDRTWLLLQNWWDDMQFIEVSVDYFKACKGELSFVEFEKAGLFSNSDHKVTADNCYETNRFRVAECFLNKAEGPERHFIPQPGGQL